MPDFAQCMYRMRDGDTDASEGSILWWYVKQEDTDIIAYRPILNTEPKEPEWDGEGLPPVGVKCEVRHIGVWHETTIVGHDEGLPVFKTDWCERYAYACGADFDFRPIRSAEDKAVEEMLSLDCEPHEGMLSRADFCRALYRAGYRPQAEG